MTWPFLIEDIGQVQCYKILLDSFCLFFNVQHRPLMGTISSRGKMGIVELGNPFDIIWQMMFLGEVRMEPFGLVATAK